MVLLLTVTCFSWYCDWLSLAFHGTAIDCHLLFMVLRLTVTCFSWYCNWLTFHGTAVDRHLLFMVLRLTDTCFSWYCYWLSLFVVLLLTVTCFSALDRLAGSLCRPRISDCVSHFKSPLIRSTGCQNTVVGRVTGLRPGRPRNLIRLPIGLRDISPKCPHLLWGLPSLLCTGYSGFFFCGVKRPGRVADYHHVVPSLRWGGPHTYTRAYDFMTCTGTPLPLFYKAFQIASFRMVA